MKQPQNTSHTLERQEVYESLFGETKHVWHEKKEQSPHIDIYCFPPGHAGRDFYTLVTNGMSDRAMNLPEGMPPQMQQRRVELVFYCSEPKAEYAELLRRLAHYVSEQNTWFGMGHTMETHSIELLHRSDVDALLFLLTPVIPDDSLPIRLDIEGDPVWLLWVIPITAEECALVRQAGCLETVMRAFSKHGRPCVFQPDGRRPA